MTRQRIREIAAAVLLLALALPAYTCAGYVAPDGSKVTDIPKGADSAQYLATRISYYPLHDKHATDVGLWVTILAFTWPIPLVAYRRRRRDTPQSGRLAGVEIVIAVASAYFIYGYAAVGRLAVGTYLALATNVALLSCALADARNAWRARRAANTKDPDENAVTISIRRYRKS